MGTLSMFNFDDALIFFSIGYMCHHKSMATLAGILLATDAINRSTPSREELEAALNKLSASGYIEISGEDYFLTPDGKVIYYGPGETNPPERTVFDALHDVQRALEKKYRFTENNSTIEITERQYRNAKKNMLNSWA